MTVLEKINQLRVLMNNKGLAATIFPTSDPHQSEYVADYYQSRAYFSGFTGSAGTLVVLSSKAALWTDGRYFLQAEEELAGSTITLMKMGDETTPSIGSYLKTNLKRNEKVAVDKELFSYHQLKDLNEELKVNAIHLENINLANEAWERRPSLPNQSITPYPLAYAGLSVSAKLRLVRSVMSKNFAKNYCISSLDDIAWLTNLRGMDITYTPVFYSYFLLTPERSILFTHVPSVTAESLAVLKEANIEVVHYKTLYTQLKIVTQNIALDLSRTSAAIVAAIPAEISIISLPEITATLKTQKNEAELRAATEAHIKDGVAISNFLHWLSTTDRSNLTDFDTMTKVEEFRKQQEHFVCHSFTPIFALGANGAIVHRHATAENATKINQDGLMVLDSGAQFLEGTTDITRTILFGNPTEEQKTDYTLVLKAHIMLANATFLEGATGAQLDGITRYALWQQGINFNHGTGHGVGAMLAVHEGPGRINPTLTYPVKAGLITSIEPGIYRSGKHGIRLENLYYTEVAKTTEFGTFLRFTVLTLAPFISTLIDKSLLNDDEMIWLNHYHQQVYDTLSPHLNPEVKAWLQHQTEAL